MSEKRPPGQGHIRLTSHPEGEVVPIKWGAADPAERGPVIATLTEQGHRNVIGTHSGSYAIYRALAVLDFPALRIPLAAAPAAERVHA